MYRIAICDDDLVFGSLLEQYLQNFAKTRRIPIDVLVFARGGRISGVPDRRTSS